MGCRVACLLAPRTGVVGCEFMATWREPSESGETRSLSDRSGGKGPPHGLAESDIQRRADQPDRDSTSPDRRKHKPCDLLPDRPACGPPFPPAHYVADQPRRNQAATYPPYFPGTAP